MNRTAGPVVLLLTAALAVSVAAPASAQEEDQGPASLTVCNKGNRRVNVALGSHDLALVAPTLHVVAWYTVEPGACSPVYDFQRTAFIPLPAHLAFAFLGPQGQMIPARVATIPDIGSWTHYSAYMAVRFPSGNGPALTRSSKQLCVSTEPVDYEVPFNSNADCASQRPRGVQGALSPMTAQIFFHPSARHCTTDLPEMRCRGGRYYLDVAPKTGDLELHATHGDDHPEESVVQPRTPEQNARDLANGAREATAIANAIVNGRPLPGPRSDEPLDFSQKRAQWWQSSTRPAAAYQASWMGQIVVVRGTVASVGGQAMDATIVLKESPGLTVCPQYPNRLRQIYGADLNALVGKTVEVTGEVERFSLCGSGATIRIFEVEQFRLAGAR
jgi:hypothetical protein